MNEQKTWTETFPLDHFIVRELCASRIRPGYTHNRIMGIKCPRCARISRLPETNEVYQCECGLSMAVSGISLICTIEIKKGAGE